MSETALPTAAEIISMRDAVAGQIQFARNYTRGLLDAVPDELWGVIPPGASTHFAWQIGHLTVAQYGLMLFRQRGRAEGDLDLLPSWLRKKYGKGTTPAADLQEVPAKSELLALMDRVHEESLATLPTLTAEVLSEPIDMPYAVYPIKLGALLFCPLHESIHAGQIGLLRRLHGLEPVR